MRPRLGALCLVVPLALAACARGADREWMKIDQSYTTAEFRRDYTECSKGGKLDEDCMKRRGWVAVTAPKAEEKPTTPQGPAYRPR